MYRLAQNKGILRRLVWQALLMFGIPAVLTRFTPHLAALSTTALLLRYNQSEQAKSSFQHPARRDARSRKI